MKQVISGAIGTVGKDSGGVFFAIVGNVGLADVILTYGTGANDYVTSDATGNYAVKVRSGADVTITPTLTGYTFAPTHTDYVGVVADAFGEDYVASPNTFSISGNAGVASAKVFYGAGVDDYVTADGSGVYSVTGIALGSDVTLTPFLENYAFTPESNTYTSVSADKTGEDYTISTAYYVRKSGNDSTGDGSYAAPWLTIVKAFTVVGAGHTLMIGDGTYAEGVAGSYWTIAKNLASPLVVRAELASSGDVTITGNGHSTYNIYANGMKDVQFKWLKFGMSEGSKQLVRIGSFMTNVHFIGCTFMPTSSATQYSLYASALITNSIISGCTFNASSTALSAAFQIENAGSHTLTISDTVINGGLGTGNLQTRGFYVKSAGLGGLVEITNSQFTGDLSIWIMLGGTFAFSDCTISGGEVLVGVDGTGDNTSQTTTATFTDCTINKTGTTGHALIFGLGSFDCVVDNVTIPSAYDYGLVMKECNNNEVKNSNITGGTASALLYKAAINVNSHNNILTGTGSSGAFQIRNGDDASHHCANWIFSYNEVNVTGVSKVLQIGNDDHDDGGGVCDYNTYQNNSGLGVVRNDANVANLTELQAAWADYDVTTNDIRGNDWSIAITDLTLDANKQQFVIKRNASYEDVDSILFIDSDTGLLYVNGVAATAGDASIVYAGTTLTVTVKASVTAQLPAGTWVYGIQSVTAADVVAESYGGTFTITADNVKATA